MEYPNYEISRCDLRTVDQLLRTPIGSTLPVHTIEQFRANHLFVLNECYEWVRQVLARQYRYDWHSGCRLKQRSSIVAKLLRYPSLRLYTMQDIAGVRVVLQNIERADALYQIIRNNTWPNFKVHTPKNYISSPKSDGYRGIHIPLEYINRDAPEAYRHLRVELQIRTERQHTWATTLETVDLLNQHNLKAGVAHPVWTPVFQTLGYVFANTYDQTLLYLLFTHCKDIHTVVKDTLRPQWEQWRKCPEFNKLWDSKKTCRVITVGSEPERKAYAIVRACPEKRRVYIQWEFSPEDAMRSYMTTEEQYGSQYPVVLIPCFCEEWLREMYPNYFFDISRIKGEVASLLGC